MGFVDRPIRVIDTGPDNFGVSTMLRVKDPLNPNRSFRSGLFDFSLRLFRFFED